MSLRDKLIWAGVILLGTISLGIVALTRGEPVNAAWLVVAAVCIYFIAYRFYGLFVAERALGVDASVVDGDGSTNSTRKFRLSRITGVTLHRGNAQR